MPQYLISSGLPQLPSSGLRPEEAQLVTPLYQGLNNLAQRLSEVGGKVTYTQAELAERNQLDSIIRASNTKLYPLAASNLNYGQLVNLALSGGKIIARLAQADISDRKAHGIVNSPQGITAGQYGEVIFLDGYCAGVSGTVFGAMYYLGPDGLMLPDTSGGAYAHPVALGLGSAGVYLRCTII